MAKTEHYYTKFEEGKFYHIYNRCVDRQLLFKSDGNYRYFLSKCDKYLSGVLSLYAFCLLDNHFHLLVKINEDLHDSDKHHSVHQKVSKQFRLLFQCYAMSFNLQHKRIGTLFQTPFKRALVTDESYFTRLIYYIHANPQKHQLIADFRNWKWSSYNRILLEKKTKLKKEEILDWFGGKAAYIKYHAEVRESKMPDLKLL